VTAHTSNRPDKVSEFFNKLAGDLQQQSEWKDWFCALRLKTPVANILLMIPVLL